MARLDWALISFQEKISLTAAESWAISVRRKMPGRR